MSYILEALKKADAERERGAVPDLHAQPVPLEVYDEGMALRGAKHWLWLAAGAVISLLVVLAWQFTGQDIPPAATAVALAPAPVPVTASAPAAVPEAAPLTPTEPGPASAQASVPVSAAASAMPAEPAPLSAPRARAEPKKVAVAVAAVSKVAKKPAPKSNAPKVATQAPPAPERVPMLTELPEDVRRQVPPMALGGSVYSPQPASRMVIVNGQVTREGSTLGPDLRLEHIGPKSAVFSVRGQRFEMPF